jgi:hypothetical protein
MTPTVSRFEGLISRFRHTRTTNNSMVRSVDPGQYWKQLALKAIDGGYFKNADEFVKFVEACTRYLSFEQVMQDREYVHGIRSLADAIARKWACGSAPENAPSSDEITGLLQSEWVTSGEYATLRSAGRDAE